MLYVKLSLENIFFLVFLIFSKKSNTTHDRDVNASKNILRRALASQSTGTVDNWNGAKVRPKEILKVSGGSGVEVLKKRGETYALKPVGL